MTALRWGTTLKPMMLMKVLKLMAASQKRFLESGVDRQQALRFGLTNSGQERKVHEEGHYGPAWQMKNGEIENKYTVKRKRIRI